MGLISRVSSRTYRSNTMFAQFLFSTFVSAIFAQVDTNAQPPSELAGLKMRGDDYPFIFIVILGSALGLILTIASIVYCFSQEDPSKTNIVYKLSYQRLKTD